METDNQKTTFKNKLDNYFKISERGSSFSKETIGGIVNFMVTCYVMVVIPNIITGTSNELLWKGIFLSTILSAIIVTASIALLGNIPMVYAPGLGLSSYIASLMSKGIYNYTECLVIIMFAGIIFLALTLTKARQKMVDAIPKSVKDAMAIGIGLFIAQIAFDDSILAFLANGPTYYATGSVLPIWVSALVTFVSFVLIVILEKKHVKGGIFYGIIGGTILYLIIEACFGINPFAVLTENSWLPPFEEFYNECLLKLDFKSVFTGESMVKTLLTAVLMVFAFTLVDVFDTFGTLFGVCSRANLIKDGDMSTIPSFNKIMIADSACAIVSSLIGVPTCTAYIESTAGIESGARTGFSALVTSVLFILCMFLSPIAMLIPSAATSSALIYVGILMFGAINQLDFVNIENAVPSFLTIILMPLTGNIAFGIAFGLIVYCIMMIFEGKAKEVSVFAYLSSILFIVYFATYNIF
ncbi:MAG: NCS2 family permease [Clostridia bacterium]|nr:NCS2 family permease [Clostridia bacterium]